MYNLVACYDTLELKSRGDVLSDKVSSQSCQTYKRCSKWRSASTCPLHHLHFVPTIPSIVKHRLHVCCLLSRPPLHPGVPQLPGLARRRPQDLPVRVHPHRHDPRPQVLRFCILTGGKIIDLFSPMSTAAKSPVSACSSRSRVTADCAASPLLPSNGAAKQVSSL